ncbi:hypothetical protein T440DRAFT_133000 [Plenodomus tracheiphilus IPT5]|uniref:FAR1 domain-containing protein n=1 Tax=Plenodomus tracheiphilus IPT5 TaxID=1408161 RepID=A0A6A7B4J1_9PLEO|nr:hypothetical protein T440DRAFT_133000 [Plenodomus tracheiphilus IPT5]
MNDQLPLPLYNTLYEFNQLHPYPPNQQASYQNNQQQHYPPIQQTPYIPSSQPPYLRSQQTPDPTSQLPTPYPTVDTPFSNGDSDVEELGQSSADELEHQPAQPALAPTFDERRRITKAPTCKPRKRSHGDLHEFPRGGIDLSRENEDSFQVRDLLPPPERVYNSFDEAIAAVRTFGKAHGVSYSKNKWSRNRRHRLCMTCHRSGVHKDMHKEGTKRRNMKESASKKCDCRMQFWILAMDYTNLEGQWRVKWANDRKSIVHNHPPQRHEARDAPVVPARIPGFKIA